MEAARTRSPCTFFWDSNVAQSLLVSLWLGTVISRAQFRLPPVSNPIGLIDAKLVERYENNWEILR